MSVAWAIEAQLGGDYAAVVKADAPEAWFRLNDAVASSTAADSSGNGNTGTVHGTVTFGQATDQPGGNTAALLDGASGYITSAAAIAATPSIEAWVKPTGTGFFLRIFGSGANFPFELATGGGTLQFFVNFTTLSPGWIDTGATLPNGVWTYVAMTWDGATLRVYKNGAPVYSNAAWTGKVLQSGTAIVGATIGPGSFWPGTLDEVALYATALTDAQIMRHYLAGRWTDLSADRAHPQGAPITLYGGIDGTGKPGDVIAAPSLWSFALDNSATNSLATRGAYSPNGAARRTGWTDGIRCRLRVTIGANPTFYKFAGWIEDIVPEAGLFADQVVRVIVSDWLGAAASALAIGVTAQAGKTGDQLTDSLAQLVAPAPYATRYDAGTTTYAYGLDDLDRESKVLAGLQNVAASGLDRIYLAGDTATGGVLRFEDHTFRRTFATDAFTLSDTAPGGQPGLALTDLQVARRRDDRLNRIRFTMKPRKVDGANVVLYAENIDPGTAVAVPAAGGVVTLWCDYADPSQLAQQVAIVPASGVAPVATTDYLLNSAANGSGTNLTASCTVVATFFGNTAKVVITNNHATLPAFRTLLQLRGKGIYAYQAVTLESIDTASVQLSGERPATGDMPYQSSQVVAQAAADYYRTLTASDGWTPIDALSVFVPVSDEATLWTLVNAETSTPFSISETLSGLSMYPLWVNKWQLDIDERDHVTFTFVPEPRDPNQYWSLGVAGLSELGLTTLLAPF